MIHTTIYLHQTLCIKTSFPQQPHICPTFMPLWMSSPTEGSLNQHLMTSSSRWAWILTPSSCLCLSAFSAPLQYHITQRATTWCLPNRIRMCLSMRKMYSSIKYHLFESIWSACTTLILCIYPWPFSTTHHSVSPVQQSPPSTSNTHLRYVLFCYSSLLSCADHESDSSSDSVSSISR